MVQNPRQVYLLAKGAGDANAFILGPDGQKLVLLEVTVARDLTPLADALARLLPGSRIKIEAVGDNVVLTGSVIDPIDANRAADIAGRYAKNKDAVVNMLAVGTKEQVLLKVQVAEMQRDAIRRIGVNVPTAVLNTNITFTKVIQDGEAVWGPGPRSLGRLVEKLEGAGLVRTLAEPNLTAVSGETAKFLAGGEFPVPMAAHDGQIAMSWKTFGVNVAFKPVVMSEGRISLTIAAEVSQLSTDGAVDAARSRDPRAEGPARRDHAWSCRAAARWRWPACCRTRRARAWRACPASRSCPCSARSSAATPTSARRASS